MLNKKDRKYAVLFTTPAYITILIFTFFALGFVVYMSFFNFTFTYGGEINQTFIGLENYKHAFSDELFFKSIKNTFIFAIISVPAQVVISLVLAYILNKKVKGSPLFRILFFLPMITATSSIIMIFMFIFSVQGPINSILLDMGLIDVAIDFFRDPKYALYIIAICSIWQSVPFSTIIFSAAFSDVDKSLYEASDLDGASGLTQFFKITLPEILPVLIFIIVLGVVGSLQMFDQSYIVQAPNKSTTTVAYLIYTYAFDPSYSSMGYAATLSVILGVIIYIIATIVRLFDRKD